MKNILIISMFWVCALPAETTQRHEQEATFAGPTLNLCAAVRGNGELIFAHFAALARLTESYGVFDAMAGGSSASVTTFLYESIVLNPAVSRCGSRNCTEKERAQRVAMLLKSLEGYLEVLSKSDEALALKGVGSLVFEIKKSGVDVLIEQGRLKEPGEDLKVILKAKELRSLINPDIFRMLEMGRVQEVYNLIVNFGSFKTPDKSIFFQPGLFNFKQFPKTLDRVADFYAGRGPVEGSVMAAFLDKCAVSKNTGRMWKEIKSDKKDTCAPTLYSMVKHYRDNYDSTEEFNHRSQDFIGRKMPSLVCDSLLEGRDLVEAYQANQEEYWQNPKPNYKFEIPFERVQFGYWGRPQDLNTIQRKFKKSEDPKSRKFYPLGPNGTTGAGWTRWEEALKTSPAEPGLASIQPMDENRVSTGGWSDLHPTLALKAMGCQNIVYLTRRTGESAFALGVAKLLGLSKEEERKIYSLESKEGEPPSSFLKSIRTADAVYCTHWNQFKLTQFDELMKNAYHSPVVTRSEFFKNPNPIRPPKIQESTDIEGCSCQ